MILYHIFVKGTTKQLEDYWGIINRHLKVVPFFYFVKNGVIFIHPA